MTSNIVGITLPLEDHLQEYHAFREENEMNKLQDRNRLFKLNEAFKQQSPLTLGLYLLDDTTIVDENGQATDKTFTFKPGTHSTGLYAVEPGKDDFRGNWNIRGNTAAINDEPAGEVAYAHNSNKTIDELLNNVERQQSVAFKTMMNQLTFLNRKIHSYDAHRHSPQFIADRADTIRAYQGLVTNTFELKDRHISTQQYRWDN